MRLLVRGDTFEPGDARMAMALAGLALRGHEVAWHSALPGALKRRAEPGLAPAPADIVVGGAGGPVRTALAGWLAGAHVMLLGLHAADLDRWGWIDRWAWDSLHSVGLVEDGESERLAADPRGLVRERIGLWPAGAPAAAPDPAHPDVEVLERACERALARHQSGTARAAVFLDRDGTLIREIGYLSDPDGVELLPGVGRALRNLEEAGIPVVVVSNQSGIGRGRFTEADAHAVNARLRQQLRRHGVELTAIYLCPHRPDEACPCRKPRPGSLERAAEDLDLALTRSVMIGDKRIDAAAGRNAGGQGVLVRTGYGREEEGRTDAGSGAPDQVCDDLGAAIAWWSGPE